MSAESISFNKKHKMDKMKDCQSAKHLHKALFVEEYDGRCLEKDGWSEEHITKINRRRARLGVSPISSQGSTDDNSAMEFCEREIKAAQSNQETEYTAIALDILKEIQNDEQLLQEDIKARLTGAKDIDPEDPLTWTETMIINSYELLAATDRWELDAPMSFEKFKEKLFSDKDFARSHAPRGKMDRDDYNPWATFKE